MMKVGDIPEKEIIARVCRRLGKSMPPYPFGAGDDCSVFDFKLLEKNACFTVDAVILGRHFDYSTSPQKAGKKLVLRNISDIASMGATPEVALIAVVVSKNAPVKFLEEFALGAGKAAQKFGLKITGGDIACLPASPKDGEFFFSAHMALVGKTENPPLLRKGARANDAVFVTGGLGYSYESGKHLDFVPRVEEGAFLSDFAAQMGARISCMDISDGLASDLREMIPSGCGAYLDASQIPRAKFRGKPASLERAMSDGEDYELVFTVDTAHKKSLFEAYKKRFGIYPCEIGLFKRLTSCTKAKTGTQTHSKKERPIFIKCRDGSFAEFSKKGFDQAESEDCAKSRALWTQKKAPHPKNSGAVLFFT